MHKEWKYQNEVLILSSWCIWFSVVLRDNCIFYLITFVTPFCGPTSRFSRTWAKDQHSTASRQRKQPDPLRNVKRVHSNLFLILFSLIKRFFRYVQRYVSTAKRGDAISLRHLSTSVCHTMGVIDSSRNFTVTSMTQAYYKTFIIFICFYFYW